MPHSPKSKNSKSYETGYKKPPLHRRFKPGVSGNPSGRPKKQATASELMLQEARRLIPVTIGGEVKHLSKLDALIRRLFDLGMKGNLRAAQTVLLWHSQAQVAAEAVPSNEPLTDSEIAVLQLISTNGGLNDPE